MNASGVNALRPGLFFHSVNLRGAVEWQGFIRSRRDDGRMELQLFRWTDGRPSRRAYATEAEMADWRFFRTPTEWRDAGNALIDKRQSNWRKRASVRVWLEKTGQFRQRSSVGKNPPEIVSGDEFMSTEANHVRTGANN
jgi:hypothetical protein